ncbi:MAG: WbqC family protein [Saprospiraceae bacterium]
MSHRSSFIVHRSSLKKMLLLETLYLPSIAWCSAVWREEVVALETAEHYKKGSLRNRCYLAGPNGPQRLSIPLVKGKHQQTPIREVQISYDEPWQRQHWRTIQAAYGNAPFFEHYADDIRPFYERRWAYLFDYNFEFQTLILQNKMGWTGKFVFQTDYFPLGTWTQGPDFRDSIQGDLNGFPAWFSPARYPQVFEERTGFLPNLSVLDLLLCCGKTSGEVLGKPLILPN